MKTIRFWILGCLVALLACGQVGAPTVDASSPIPSGWDDAAGALVVPPQKAEPVTPELVPAQVAPPPVVDKRTPAQLSAAACTSPSGKWLCKNLKQPPQVLALGTSPIIPVGQTVPNWFVDPANVTGTASDSNDCVTSTTQCLTFQEIEVHRWGTYAPRLQQTTTINVWSSQAAGSLDFLYINPYMEGAAVIVKGNLGATQQIATGTIAVGGFVAKVRSTGTLLQANTGATAINQLVVNATHSSRAWTSKSLGGGVFAMSEPIAPITVPGTITGGTSVDTWATGDNVTVFAPPIIHMAEAKPKVANLAGGFTNIGLWFWQVNVSNPTGLGFIVVNPEVGFVESFIPGLILFEGSSRLGLAAAEVNSIFSDVSGGSIAGPLLFAGGRLDFGFISSGTFSNDIIVGIGAAGGVGLQGAGQSVLAAAYIDTGATLQLVQPVRGDISAGGTTIILWGPGGVNLRGNARLSYPAGAGAAAAAFLETGAPTLSGQTKSCLDVPSAATAFGTCNITVSAANLDTNLGTTTGCLSTGPSSICNYGP